VSNLDRDALVEILVEPKNAVVKQYQRMFELDGVQLEMTPDALEAVAEQALARGTGARGLRAILEEVLLDVMYDVPSRTDVGKVRGRPSGRARQVAPALMPRVRRATLRQAPAAPPANSPRHRLCEPDDVDTSAGCASDARRGSRTDHARCRWCGSRAPRFDTDTDVELLVGMLEGDLASQHAVESELAREASTDSPLDATSFVERVRTAEARRREELVEALAAAGRHD